MIPFLFFQRRFSFLILKIFKRVLFFNVNQQLEDEEEENTKTRINLVKDRKLTFVFLIIFK